MPSYTFHKVSVYDQLGGAVRLSRNSVVRVTDPMTGLTAPGLMQDGMPVPFVRSNLMGAADFTATISTVRMTAPNGLSEEVTAPGAVMEHATEVATSTATDVAARVASDIAHGDSHVALDADGTPYFDLSAPGTQVMQVDTDGIPYFL